MSVHSHHNVQMMFRVVIWDEDADTFDPVSQRWATLEQAVQDVENYLDLLTETKLPLIRLYALNPYNQREYIPVLDFDGYQPIPESLNCSLNI